MSSTDNPNHFTSLVRDEVKHRTKLMVQDDVVEIVNHHSMESEDFKNFDGAINYTVNNNIGSAADAVTTCNIFSYLQRTDSLTSIVARVANTMSLSVTKSLQQIVKDKHNITRKMVRRR